MVSEQFRTEPLFVHDRTGDRYIGTWYGHDCYVTGNSLIVRSGDEPADYGSTPNVGWNTYAADSALGGLGEGKQRAQYAIESRGDNWQKAELCALAFLGREYLDKQETSY